jgi:hypothetical protein
MVVYSREREERKKENNSKAQALACLMSIVLSFVFCTMLLIVGHH